PPQPSSLFPYTTLFRSRALLAAIPGVQLVDIPDGDTCCGSAGIYNLVEPESAREIGRRKVDNILTAKPELLVSANPGCTLQIAIDRKSTRLNSSHRTNS